jgi:hypothetical protein
MAEKHYNKKPLEFALIEYARGLIFAHNPGFSRYIYCCFFRSGTVLVAISGTRAR